MFGKTFQANAGNVDKKWVLIDAKGEIAISDAPGRGFEVRRDLVERLTVRKTEIRAHALVS